MSSEVLRELDRRKAFTPAPSLWEMARSHVPFGELGFGAVPEATARGGLVDGTGLVLVRGDSGGGKSSTLAYVCAQLATESTPTVPPRRYLPVFVPVAGRLEETRNLEAFGRAAVREVLAAIESNLGEDQRERLRLALADKVTTQHSGPRFNVNIGAGMFGIGGGLGFALAQDLVSVIGAEPLDGRGGLRSLGDICRARGFELIVCVEDTDGWAQTDRTQDARAFFASVARPLASEVELAVAIAVQNTWLEGDETLDEVAAVRERAVAIASVPAPATEEQAREMVERILDRRIAYALEDRKGHAEYTAARLFEEGALAAFGHRLHADRSVRSPLGLVRDVLDRNAGDMPERITDQHVLDVM